MIVIISNNPGWDVDANDIDFGYFDEINSEMAILELQTT